MTRARCASNGFASFPEGDTSAWEAHSLRFLSDTIRIIRRYDFQAIHDREASGAASSAIGSPRGELRTGNRTAKVWNPRRTEDRMDAGDPP